MSVQNVRRLHKNSCSRWELLIGPSGISMTTELVDVDYERRGGGGGGSLLSPHSTSALTHIPASQKAVRRWPLAGQWPSPVGAGV